MAEALKRPVLLQLFLLPTSKLPVLQLLFCLIGSEAVSYLYLVEELMAPHSKNDGIIVSDFTQPPSEIGLSIASSS
jgi:hypothetical protein